MDQLRKQNILATLSLFTSFGTLICCALPALLVTLGLGAVMAGIISTAPWITALSDYKVIVFSVAGVLLMGSAFMQWHARNAPCPADPIKAKACTRLRKISIAILVLSFIVYGVGFFFAFLAADLLL